MLARTQSRKRAVLVALLSALAPAALAPAQVCSAPAFAPRVPYATAETPWDLKAADFNRDGVLDLVGVMAFTNTFFLMPGNAAGGFGAPTSFTIGTGYNRVEVADFNRDGRPDVALVPYAATSTVLIRLGDGSGGFTAAPNLTAGSFATDAAAADFDEDGLPDLVVSAGTGTTQLFLGNGNGSFGAPAVVGPSGIFAVAAADFDRDGHQDLALLDRGTDVVRIARGNGAGSFGAPTAYSVADQPEDVAVGDLDRDGILDLVSVNSGTPKSITVSLGDGTGGFAPGVSYPTFIGGGNRVALADLDGDGDLDVAVPQNGAFDLFVAPGRGDGTLDPYLSFAIPNSPFSVAAGDFNRDGRTDLAVGRGNTNFDVNVFTNATGIPCAAASFGPSPRAFPTGGTTPVALALGRLNGDARPDLVVAEANSNTVAVLLATGPGAFSAPTTLGAGTQPFDVILGDLDEDGRLDLVVANSGSNDVAVRLGDGAGGFGPPTAFGVGLTPAKLALGDVDQDGHLDLAVANYNGDSVTLLHGDGSGALGSPATIPVAAQPTFVALADMNEDGQLDLVTAHYAANEAAVRPGVGGGAFGAPAATPLGVPAVGGLVGDFNEDGHLDLALASDTANAMLVLSGDGTGGLGAPTAYAAGSSPQRVAVGDVNHDGHPDLAVSNSVSNDVSLRLGNGAGGFGAEQRVGTVGSPYGLRIADVDDDGAADVLLAAGGSEAIVQLPWTGAGLASVPTYPALTNARDLALGDLDRNGRIDAVVGSSTLSSVAFLSGDGAGGFAAPALFATGSAPSSPALGDMNHDGRPDLVVATRSTNTVSLLLGNGAGGLGVATAFPAIGQASAVLVRDFDGDGDLDVAATLSVGPRLALMLGNGAGGLGAPVAFGAGDGATAAAAGDYNRDGWLDVAVSDASTNTVSVLLGAGGGNFTVGPQAALGFVPGPLAAGDVNRDGRLDLVVGPGSGSASSASVLIGVGDGSFVVGAPFAVARGARVQLAEVTLDGRLDLVATEPGSGLVYVLAGDGAGGFGSAQAHALPALPLLPQAADLDGDGRADLVVPLLSAGRVGVLRNTNCQQRHLRLAPDVSGCNLPGIPFSVQPALRVVDDGGSTNQCEVRPVTAALVPGTGTLGAILSGSNPINAVSGVAAFTDLSVDLPGRGYRLAFTHPATPDAASRGFTQAPAVALSGPAAVCQGTAALFDAGAGWDTYAWTLDGSPVGVGLRHLALGGLGAGSYTVQVTVQQDGCSTSDARPLSVQANLSAVAISTPGPTTVCPACIGGTVVVADSGGGATSHAWGYRTVPGGAITFIPGETGASYVISGGDFPGPGTYYLVERSTPTCGATMVSNEIAIFVTTPPDAVQFFAITSTSGQNLLQWINPALGAAYVTTHVRYNAVPGSSACTFPTGAADGTGLPVPAGLPGQPDSFVHGSLANDGTTYCYALFVEQTGPVFSLGRFAKGRPFDTSGPVKWAYSTGATAMAPPSIGPSVYVLSNDRVLHAVTRGTTGGAWPAGWTPLLMNAPAQWRAPVVTTGAVPGASQVVLVGSQDGSAYAVNAQTGAGLWNSPLGQVVQGAPSALLTAMGGLFDYVFAGTRNSTGDNRFYALAAADGTPVGPPFDNGGGGAAIGVINAGSSVDVAGNRVYFASRAHPTGSNQTLWALDVGAGGLSLAWGVPVGDIDGAPTRRGARLYAGTNTGVVVGVDTADGVSNPWSFATGDGGVKAFVFPDRSNANLYLSTAGRVWGLADGSPTPLWPAVTLPGPSNPLFNGGSRLFVGGADGRLYQLDLSGAGPSSPPAVTSVVLGDGAAAVGSPTLDVLQGMVYVGSEAGIVYGVLLPVP